MKRADWNLLAISAGKGEALTPVQLQKSLFLFEKAFPQEFEDRGYDFAPYDYGPFSASVYLDARNLCAGGLVSITCATGGWSLYAATPAGLTRAEEISQSALPAALSYLRQVVAWARALSFQQLVRAIYEKFPEYRENSIFKS